jgi:methionyl-tRNA formyltransferase
LQLKVLPVTDKQSLDELMQKGVIKSRLGILIDFGIIVSQTVIDFFPLGIVNSHFSILPEWRGADPITFSILSGQDMTGVSLMLLVKAMDEGPLLAYGEQPLDGTETNPELTQRLIYLSDALLRDQLPRYIKQVSSVPQTITGRKPSYSRKLAKEDSIIDWRKPANQLEREIRAFIEWPKSRTTLSGKEVIITKAVVVNQQGKSGERKADPKALIVYAGEQALQITELKPAGKPIMSAQAFLAGYHQ